MRSIVLPACRSASRSERSSKSGLLHRCWIRLPGGLAGDGRSPTFISQNAHGGLKGSVPKWLKACSDGDIAVVGFGKTRVGMS
jgi:hypothetical protein